MSVSRPVVCGIVLVILGLIFICVGVVLMMIIFPKMIRNKIEESVKLKKGSEAFNAWLDPPASIFIEFNFFNVTNYMDVIDADAKPQLTEIGPYVYREVRTKSNVTFSGDDLSYLEYKTYYFDSEKSGGRQENDIVYTVNLPALAIATIVENKHWGWWTSWVLMTVRLLFEGTNTRLFESRSVKDLLWGFDFPLFDEINKILNKTGIDVKFPKFGLYTENTANGTANGELVISSGIGGIENLGIVKTWNNSRNLHYWTARTCNMINGTDGTLWHPFVSRSDVLYVFDQDICRSVYVSYESDDTVSTSKLPVYRFTPPASVMADHIENPDNICFCTPNNMSCLGTGVLNVGVCKAGAPIIMSQPHFYQADPKYVAAIGGMHPNKELHQTVIDVEPYTGLVLNASKKVQVNMYIRKLKSFKDTDKIHEPIVFPLLWGNEHAAVSNEDAAKLRQTLLTAMKITEGIQYGVMALGGLLVLCGALILIILLAVRRQNDVVVVNAEPDNDQLLDNQSPSDHGSG